MIIGLLQQNFSLSRKISKLKTRGDKNKATSESKFKHKSKTCFKASVLTQLMLYPKFHKKQLRAFFPIKPLRSFWRSSIRFLIWTFRTEIRAWMIQHKSIFIFQFNSDWTTCNTVFDFHRTDFNKNPLFDSFPIDVLKFQKSYYSYLCYLNV